MMLSSVLLLQRRSRQRISIPLRGPILSSYPILASFVGCTVVCIQSFWFEYHKYQSTGFILFLFVIRYQYITAFGINERKRVSNITRLQPDYYSTYFYFGSQIRQLASEIPEAKLCQQQTTRCDGVHAHVQNGKMSQCVKMQFATCLCFVQEFYCICLVISIINGMVVLSDYYHMNEY